MKELLPAKSEAADPDFFRALEIKCTQALVNCDLELVKHLHTADYELISPPGRTMTISDYLSKLAVEPFYSSWEYGDINVRITEGMAAIRYQAKITFPSGDIFNLWHTDIYEFQDGSWKAAWSQATQVAPDLVQTTGDV